MNGGQHVTISMQEYSQLVQAMNGQQPRGPPPPSGLGNPGPLGLGGFAMTTFILSVFNAGVFIDAELEAVVLPIALFYGGIAQFIAGLYEFKIPNTFGATAFCSYGAFWASFATYVKFVVPLLPASKANQTTGLFLLCWTIFTLYMMFGSFRVSWALFSVFVPLEITFILLTAGAFSDSKHCTEVGGWFGIVTAFCAWYCSGAVVINSTFGKQLLPLGVYKNPTEAKKA
jgi:succinate-acetate transporter protein